MQAIGQFVNPKKGCQSFKSFSMCRFSLNIFYPLQVRDLQSVTKLVARSVPPSPCINVDYKKHKQHNKKFENSILIQGGRGKQCNLISIIYYGHFFFVTDCRHSSHTCSKLVKLSYSVYSGNQNTYNL